MALQFEWDDEKEQSNVEKHGIDFDTAVKVFFDPNRIEYYDKFHSTDEESKGKNRLHLIYHGNPDDALHGLTKTAVCGMFADVFCTNFLILYHLGQEILLLLKTGNKLPEEEYAAGLPGYSSFYRLNSLIIQARQAS